MTTPNPQQTKAAAAALVQLGKQVQAQWRAAKPAGSPELKIWQWTLLPVVLAGLRILIVSRGNSDTARALLQNLSVPAIFMATIFPIVATGAVLLFFMGVITVIDQFRKRHQQAAEGKPKNEWLQSLILSGILLVFAGIFVLYAMPIKYIIVTCILVAVLLGVYVGSWLSTKLNKFFSRLGGLYVIALMVAAMVIVLAQVGVWLPRERLAINGTDTGIVYVLPSDDRWTKYLDDVSRLVQIVPTESITRREFVHDDRDNWLNRTPSQALSG